MMIDDKKVELPSYAFAYVDTSLKENEILLSYNFYNEAYGTNYDDNNVDSFIPHTANLKEFGFVMLECEHKMLSDVLDEQDC